MEEERQRSEREEVREGGRKGGRGEEREGGSEGEVGSSNFWTPASLPT